MNKNTKEEWNRIWDIEGATTWRRYPCSFSKICELIPAGSNVLEIGCGVGSLLYQIKTKGCEVIGVDISESAIRIMKDIYDIDGIVGEIPPLPKVENIDVIVASQTLEHFKDVDIVLKEMCKLANMSIIAVPNDILGHEECEWHHQQFTRDSIKELLFKYYNHVEIYELTDIFMASNKMRIKLPVIICKCWGVVRREE